MNSKRFGILALVLLVGLLVVAFAAIGCGGSSDDTAITRGFGLGRGRRGRPSARAGAARGP